MVGVSEWVVKETPPTFPPNFNHFPASKHFLPPTANRATNGQPKWPREPAGLGISAAWRCNAWPWHANSKAWESLVFS